MFTCGNCGAAKPDNERAAVGLVANIGFVLATHSTFFPGEVCARCSRQVRLFGVLVFVATALLVVAAIWWR